MDADTRDLLAGSIRALLKSRPGDLAAGLTELGWDEVVSDHGAAAIELLFTEQGLAGVASAALDGIVIAAGGDTASISRGSSMWWCTRSAAWPVRSAADGCASTAWS